MAPPHPGAFIREEIHGELGLTVSEATKVLDVRRATLSDLINGNAALSAEMALRIEKAFGVTMETLLNMQAWHDAYTMRQRAGEITVKPYRRPPAPEPNRRIRKRIAEAFGWIKPVASLRQTKLRAGPRSTGPSPSPRRPTTSCGRPS
jgi:antitoxin HigA-1